MEPQTEPWLRTERLDISRLAPSHLEDWLALEQDPEVMRFINGGKAPELEGYEDRFLAKISELEAMQPLGVFVLHERRGPMVGILMLKRDPRFVEDIEVGWRLRPDRWGRGYATEAAQALVGFAFEELELKRVIASALTRNHGSQAVMRRLGFARVITFTYDQTLLPYWDREQREGQLYILSRSDWELGRDSQHKQGVVHGIHHVQLAMQPGGEQAARDFYVGVLGVAERAKPASLAKRGGLWFEAGPMRLHLGLEADFVPSQKAHPALLVDDLEAVFARAVQGGFEPLRDHNLPGVTRGYLHDPFGNRIELMESPRVNPLGTTSSPG